MFAILGILFLVMACVMAWRWGGRDEQLAAFGFAVATLASTLANQHFYASTEVGVLGVDMMVLAGLVVLALRSDRFWPMYAAAFQFVGTVVHMASFAEQGDFAWAYAVGLIFWSYAVMAALVAGTWLEGRTRRLLGL
ncbi:hypothetical protein [Sandarakinorhabdus rubra]|uniref:hypothetical protein n=1 Tax=Sandarakinorhabdus rubra TaxID=2672568 RepID=UPI0013DACD06|nr:hypothetical protein [Sandarakinorhabdus rubra]